MPYSSLVTQLKADLTQLRRDLRVAEAELRAFHRTAAQLGTVRLGAGGIGGVAGVAGTPRLGTLGGGTAGANARMREEVRDQLASFRQIVQLRKELSNMEGAAGRERATQFQREERERQSRRRRELQDLRQDIQTRAREEENARRQAIRAEAQRAAQANAFFRRNEADIRRREREAVRLGLASPTGLAGRQLNRRREEHLAAEMAGSIAREDRSRRQAAAAAREQRRREEAEAARLTRAFGLPSRAEVRRQQERDLREQMRGPRGGGGGGRPPRGPDPADLRRFSGSVGRGFVDTLDRATRAAGQLDFLVGVSIFGGLGALVAEGLRLNSVFERVNLTMAATLGVTNEVVGSTGKRVEGEQRAQFLLQGTAGIYDQIRKVAAETILEEQELLETVAENLSLAQQAGFTVKTLKPDELKPIIDTIANISQLAKAVGLPGGQRQLSQEVRALFLGERLQGATVARLLGFQNIKEIKKLQSTPGKEPGTTAFVDELNKRFERAKPILDKFRDTGQGVFTTLLSQARLFLRVASEEAFRGIVGAARDFRDFLTDERVRESAEEIGRSIGEMVRGIINLGKTVKPAFDFFMFLVRNTPTLLTLFTAVKALQFTQAATAAAGAFRASGGVTGAILRRLGEPVGAAALGAGGSALGGAAAAGLTGAAAREAALRNLAGRSGGVVLGTGAGVGRNVAGVAAGAGLGGALSGRFRQAFGAPGTRIGLGATAARFGLGSLVAPVAGLGALTGGAALLAPLLLGLGGGTLIQRQIEGAERAGIAPPPGQVNRSRADLVRPIQAARAMQSAAEARARAIRQDSAEGRRGGRLQGELPLVPNALERFLFGVQERPPELTQAVTARGLEQRARQREKDVQLQRAAAVELEALKLKLAENRDKDEMRRAQLFLAQVRRNKEAEINLRAQLDDAAAFEEIRDHEARAVKRKAIEEQRLRDLKELRQDETLAVRESLAQILNDEEEAARIRAQRARMEAQRQFRNRPTPHAQGILRDTLAAINLTEQQERLSARATRFGEQAGLRGQLAGLQGRALDEIRESAAGELANAGQLLARRKITLQQFEQFRVAITDNAQEAIRKKRREVQNEGINLVNQFTQAVRQSTDLQRDYELGLLQLKERVRDRERALNRSRLSEINAVVDAQREAREAREDLASANAQRGLESAAFSAFRLEGQVGAGGFGIRTLEERVAEGISRRGQRQGEFRGLSREQRAAAIQEQTRSFLTGLQETLLGSEGLAGARAQLGELGVAPTQAEAAQLAALPGQAAALRQGQEEREQLRQRLGEEGRVVAADQGLAETREQRRRTEVEDFRSRRDENRERREIERNFRDAQAQLALEFARTKDEMSEFAREAKRAGIALSEGITKVFQKALGVRVPDVGALAAQQAGAAIAADQQATAGTVPGAIPRLQSHVGAANVTMDAATRGSFEEFIGRERQTTFGRPGQAISDLGRLTFGAVPGGDVGPQVDEFLRREFPGFRDQTVTSIPGVNLQGQAVSKETARLFQGTGSANVADQVIESVSPPFVGSRRRAAGEEERASSTTTIHLNIPGIKLAPDTQKTAQELAVLLERDSRRTPTG